MTDLGPTPDLTILETHVYRGPNIWSYDTSVHLVVDLGSLEQHPTNELPGFTSSVSPRATLPAATCRRESHACRR